MASLAKLTSVSTQTLSLLLERQRLQTISGPNATSLHLPQITRNLQLLRSGILDLEGKEGRSEAVKLLRSQYERMRNMLGSEGETSNIQSLEETPPASQPASPAASSSSLTPLKSPPSQPPALSGSAINEYYSDNPYAPYSDDPEPSPGVMLHTQRHIMEDQDVRLDQLAHSIGRQRDLSLQINGELEVHHGLLQEMDEELDQTGDRLSQARRKLDRVAKGAKDNRSAVMIGLIILVLLILIIVFKT